MLHSARADVSTISGRVCVCNYFAPETITDDSPPPSFCFIRRKGEVDNFSIFDILQ